MDDRELAQKLEELKYLTVTLLNLQGFLYQNGEIVKYEFNKPTESQSLDEQVSPISPQNISETKNRPKIIKKEDNPQ